MLKVEFTVTPPLVAAIAGLKDGTDRAIIAQVGDGETLVSTGAPVPRGESLEADMAALRTAAAELPAAFFLVKLDDGSVRQVTFTPDMLKPKLRMMYASSNGQLQQAANVQRETHITALGELKAALFAEVDKKAVMTESERINADMVAEAAKEAAAAPPRAHAMQGLGVQLDAATEAKLQAFAAKDVAAVVLAIDAKTGAVTAENSVDAVATPDDAAALFPADQPRFALIRWPETGAAVFAYVCPEGCRPKDRMVYAASKGGLKGKLAAMGAGIAKTVEMGAASELQATVEAAFKDAPAEECTASKPEAPKAPAWAKGPKMFM